MPRSSRMRSASNVVGPLAPSADDARPDPRGVRGGDLALERRRDEDVAVELERPRPSAGHGRPGKSQDRARLVEVLLRGLDVEAARVSVDGPVALGDRHDHAAPPPGRTSRAW